jgi:hypothetical protein
MKTDVKNQPEAAREAPVVIDLVPEDFNHLSISHGKVTLHGQADTWGRFEETELSLRNLCLAKLGGCE